MRKLTHIPLVHVPFGVWDNERLKQSFGESPDPEIVRKIIEGDKSYWDAVDTFLDSHSFVKVYQEAAYVEHPNSEFLEGFGIYKGKDRNVDAFFRLLERGTKFVATESREADHMFQYRKTFEKPDMMTPRDLFMAYRIDETLYDEENAVLFLGVEHKVDEILRVTCKSLSVERFSQDPTYLLDLLNSNTIRH